MTIRSKAEIKALIDLHIRNETQDRSITTAEVSDILYDIIDTMLSVNDFDNDSFLPTAGGTMTGDISRPTATGDTPMIELVDENGNTVFGPAASPGSAAAGGNGTIIRSPVGGGPIAFHVGATLQSAHYLSVTRHYHTPASGGTQHRIEYGNGFVRVGNSVLDNQGYQMMNGMSLASQYGTTTHNMVRITDTGIQTFGAAALPTEILAGTSMSVKVGSTNVQVTATAHHPQAGSVSSGSASKGWTGLFLGAVSEPAPASAGIGVLFRSSEGLRFVDPLGNVTELTHENASENTLATRHVHRTAFIEKSISDVGNEDFLIWNASVLVGLVALANSHNAAFDATITVFGYVPYNGTAYPVTFKTVLSVVLGISASDGAVRITGTFTQERTGAVGAGEEFETTEIRFSSGVNDIYIDNVPPGAVLKATISGKFFAADTPE